MRISIHRLLLVGLLLTAFPCAPSPAQWPGWGGPGGDFRVDPRDFPEGWPESGPKLIWERELGEGESSVVIGGDVAYTMYRDRDDEVVVALSAATGKVLWEQRYAAPIPDGMYVEHGEGPHATPLLHGDLLFTVGIGGMMHALDGKTGEVVWAHDLMKEFGGRPPDCGYGASPIAHGDNVIVQVGGKGSAVMAFRRQDGEVAWKAGDFGAGYASPVLARVGGVEQLIVFLRAEVAGFDPGTGALQWSHPHKTSYGVNASMPVWGKDGILFISSAYDMGSRGLRLSRKGPETAVEELWHQGKVQVHFSNVIRIGDHLYGTSGGFGPVFLTAVDARTGAIAWQERDVVSKASILDLAGKLLLLDEKGKLVLAGVSPAGVRVHAEHQLLDGRVWSAPTLVRGRLYVRDRHKIYAFHLG